MRQTMVNRLGPVAYFPIKSAGSVTRKMSRPGGTVRPWPSRLPCSQRRSLDAANLGDGFGRVLADLDHPPLNLARVRVILEMLDTNAR